MSPSCEFLSSIQKRYLGFLAALHTQPIWRLGRGEYSSFEELCREERSLSCPYYGAATGLGGRSSWLAEEAFDRALQVTSP